MKRIFMILVAFMLIGTLNAQTVEHGKLFQNTYVGINGGVITPMIPSQGTSFMSEITPTFGLEIGKNIDQVVGFSIEGQSFADVGLNKFELYRTNIVGNVKFNMFNWLFGYKGYPRAVEWLIVPGIGWMHDYDLNSTDPNYITYNTGTEINFNLGRSCAWQINLKPSIVWNCVNGNMGWYGKHADIRAVAGVTYKFGYRNGYGERTHNFTIVKPCVNEDEYNVLYEKYNELLNKESEVETDTVVVEVVVEKVIEKTITKPCDMFVNFEIGKSEISKNGMLTINSFANEYKNSCNYTVKVIGSADSSTGSLERNKKLAWERANNVAKQLLNLGIEKVSTEIEIDIDDDAEASRCAVIIAE